METKQKQIQWSIYNILISSKKNISGIYPKEMWAASQIVKNKMIDKFDIYDFLNGDNFYCYHIINENDMDSCEKISNIITEWTNDLFFILGENLRIVS